MKLARSTYYYRSRRMAAEKKVLRDRIEALCAEFPRDGYRRITHQLHAEGLIVNHKAGEGQQDIERQASHRGRGIELLGDRDEGHRMCVEHFDHLGEVGK